MSILPLAAHILYHPMLCVICAGCSGCILGAAEGHHPHQEDCNSTEGDPCLALQEKVPQNEGLLHCYSVCMARIQ